MPIKISFFLFTLLLIIFPLANAQDVTFSANLLPPGNKTVPNDEVVLDSTETLDVSSGVIEKVEDETSTVGGQIVELTQQVQFNTNDEPDVTLVNTDLPTITVKIPDKATLSAPATWNKEVQPPRSVVTSGATVTGNFLTPTSAISIGSPDVVLVFDKAVTIILEDTTGTTAYKIPGGTEWIIISGCTGTFENPDNPAEPDECSISDGVNTKIVTYHFTEFTGLSSTPSTSSTSSSGSGKTGVGSPRVFGPGSSSSGGGYNPPGETRQTVFPVWFDDTTQWYREGKISALEFLNAYQWIIKNIMK